MPLTGKQRRHLRALAHGLRPVVQIGQRGLSQATIRQIDAALENHELIKVKLGADCPIDRAAGSEIAASTDAELAGAVGRVLILYRPHPDHPRLVLPADGGPNGLSADSTAADEEGSHGPV